MSRCPSALTGLPSGLPATSGLCHHGARLPQGLDAGRSAAGALSSAPQDVDVFLKPLTLQLPLVLGLCLK